MALCAEQKNETLQDILEKKKINLEAVTVTSSHHPEFNYFPTEKQNLPTN